MSITFLNPVQEPEKKPARLAPRLTTLDGAILGFLSNSKANADRLLRFTAEELAARFKLKAVVHERKFSAGSNCPTETMDALTSRVDAVVTAIGD